LAVINRHFRAKYRSRKVSNQLGCRVTSQKNEYLIYSSSESWNLVLILIISESVGSLLESLYWLKYSRDFLVLHNCAHKMSTVILFRNVFKNVLIVTHYFFKIPCNIMLPSKPSPQSGTLDICGSYFIYTSILCSHHTCYIFSPFINHPNNIR
jgi:hypothetical protein